MHGTFRGPLESLASSEGQDIFQKKLRNSETAIAGSYMDIRLFGSMKVRASCGKQMQAAAQLPELSALLRRVGGVVDLQSLKSRRRQI